MSLFFSSRNSSDESLDGPLSENSAGTNSFNSFHYNQQHQWRGAGSPPRGGGRIGPLVDDLIGDSLPDGHTNQASSPLRRKSSTSAYPISQTDDDPFFFDAQFDAFHPPRPSFFSYNLKQNLLVSLPISFLVIPTLEIICFVMLSDIIWKYIGLDNMKKEHSDIVFTVLDFFANLLGALSALGIWICTRFILNCDLYKARSENHIVPSSEWWINGAVYGLLGFLSSTYLAYEISDAFIHSFLEYEHILKLVHFASLCIQKIAEMIIVLRSIQISLSRWWTKIPSLAFRPSKHKNKTIIDISRPTLASGEKRKLIACIVYCTYAYSILLLKTILQANLNPIRFKELLDVMHHSASNLTLSLVRPGYQMLYFKLFIGFLYVFLRWIARSLFCNYSWESEDSQEIQSLINPRRRISVNRTVPKTNLFGILLCGGIVALHWVQISGSSPVSIGAARILESVVYLIMFFWSFFYLCQHQCGDGCKRNVCNHPDAASHFSIHTFSLLLVTFLALIAQVASSLIHVFSPIPDWIAFSSSFAPIPFIVAQCMVILITKPKRVYRIVLLSVDVGFAYYSLTNEAHHIEDLLSSTEHNDWPLVFVISIFWSVLEYYALVLENIIIHWMQEFYAVVYD